MSGNRRGEKGQSLLEFALVVPVLLIILAGLLDLGRLYYIYVALTDAAAEGAAYAAIHPDDSTEIEARAVAASRGYVELETGQVAVECPACPGPASGDTLTVTVSFSFTLATPFMNVIVPDGVLPLRAIACETVIGGAMP
jgi:Flp pilus assembly protein TadG